MLVQNSKDVAEMLPYQVVRKMLNYDNKIIYIYTPFKVLSAAGVAGNLGIAAPVLGFTRGVRG
jgi:hypothetical protein